MELKLYIDEIEAGEVWWWYCGYETSCSSVRGVISVVNPAVRKREP